MGGVGLLDLGDEAAGTDDVEGGHTEETKCRYVLVYRACADLWVILPLGVIDTVLLEDFSDNRDGGVDGVGDDQDVRLGAVLGARLGEGLDDRRVGVLLVS